MIQASLTDQAAFTAFWLCFTRWMAVLIQLPIFDNLSVPNIVKVLGSFVIAWAFFPLSKAGLMAEVQSAGEGALWWLTMVHGFAGLTIGFLVKSLLSLFTAAGSILTQQVGFASVTYFDPTQGQQVGPFEKIVQWTMLVLILTSGALTPMFKGVVQSFDTVNLASLEKLGTVPDFYLEMFKGLFSSAILLAAPMIFANMLMNLVFGIVTRTIPQMNVLMVSFVVNIGMGLLLFLAVSTEFFSVAFDMYVERLGDWYNFLK